MPHGWAALLSQGLDLLLSLIPIILFLQELWLCTLAPIAVVIALYTDCTSVTEILKLHGDSRKSFTMEFITRELNTLADSLANYAHTNLVLSLFYKGLISLTSRWS